MPKTVDNNKVDGTQMTLGERIKARRKESGITQVKLASLICVSSQALALWESDQNRPKDENLQSLSKVLNSTPEYFKYGITTDVSAVIHSDEFKQVIHGAIKHMLIQAHDMDWIEMKSEQNIPAMADIVLLSIKKDKTIVK
ncbi:MAG: transcriptional regulator with XRE-family HTH domain [Phenylobacterium sp.]|jgi:transcriptional regulator with XRE-family HTH domain